MWLPDSPAGVCAELIALNQIAANEQPGIAENSPMETLGTALGDGPEGSGAGTSHIKGVKKNKKLTASEMRKKKKERMARKKRGEDVDDLE